MKKAANLIRPIGHVAWAQGGPYSPPHGLPVSWLRCVACDLTNRQDIVPALVETPAGAPLCPDHMKTSGYGLFFDLEPPCALCGEPCTEHAKPYVVEGAVVSPIRGYLCPAHGPERHEDE